MSKEIHRLGGSALVSYMRMTDEALAELSRGLSERNLEVSLVLCHSGEREADRARAMWPGARVETHGVDFAHIQSADASILEGLTADVLAQVLPIAERSIGLHRDVNVSHLIQAVASQHRRARDLIRRTNPTLGVFVAMPERLLDFFVHKVLTESGIPCRYPRTGPLRGQTVFRSRAKRLCLQATRS